MAQLKNPRWEAFARAYVRGETAGHASASFQSAGYKCAVLSARANASRLLQHADVRRRIAELQVEMQTIETRATERAVDRLAITKERVLGQLARIAFVNMLDYVERMPDGTVKFDLSRIDRDKGAAIREVVVDSATVGTGENAKTEQRIRVKLADPQAALVSLGKHFGLFVERHHVRHDYDDMNDDQLAEHIRNVATQLAQNGIDVPALVGIRTGDIGNEPGAATYDAVPISSVPEATPVPRRRTDSQ